MAVILWILGTGLLTTRGGGFWNWSAARQRMGVRREGKDAGTLLAVEVPDRATLALLKSGKLPYAAAGPVHLIYARRSALYTNYLTA